MISSEQFRNVKVVILDVDGVLTDGKLGYGGPELVKFFHVRDGHWIKLAMRSGLRVGVLTGRSDAASSRRAQDLGLDFYVEGALDKLTAFEKLCPELGVTPAECMYIGDDVVDMPVMRRVGVAVAVADAMPELDEVAGWRTRAPGGHGAVCEALHRLLEEQGRLETLMARYRR